MWPNVEPLEINMNFFRFRLEFDEQFQQKRLKTNNIENIFLVIKLTKNTSENSQIEMKR